MAILNLNKLKNSKLKLNSQINQLMNAPVGSFRLTKVFSMKSLRVKF